LGDASSKQKGESCASAFLFLSVRPQASLTQTFGNKKTALSAAFCLLGGEGGF